MRAGRLRHQITFQQIATLAPVGPGDVATDYADVLTTWAAIDALSGRELVAAQAISNEVTHRIIIRYTAGLTAQMRVKFVDGAAGRTRYFNLLTPPMDIEDRQRELQFMGQEDLRVV